MAFPDTSGLGKNGILAAQLVLRPWLGVSVLFYLP